MNIFTRFLARIKSGEHPAPFFIQWVFISGLAGIMAGSASALFLLLLEWVGALRDTHLWLIALLPIAGFAIGAMYYYLGKGVETGNNLIIDEYHSPKETIPVKMAPLVLLGTLVTHLFGGSAGREGTAVQMGASLADQLTSLLRLNAPSRQVLLVAGISAGFASVFGTPLAGAVFALEVLVIGRMRYDALVPSLLAAFAGDFVCTAWGVHHTHYEIGLVPSLTPMLFLYGAGAAALFGVTAMIFAKTSHFFSAQFRQYISYPPLRPMVGGAIIAATMFALGNFRYAGLGVPTIIDAFSADLPWYDCIAKLLYTTFTLGSGFKGGEVTPLFYVGATLGNALSDIIPLPVALLAGMGFVGVFSGATNTPLACTIMGMELFGSGAGVFLALSCAVAYIFSGHSGIYSSQAMGIRKYGITLKDKKQVFSDI